MFEKKQKILGAPSKTRFFKNQSKFCELDRDILSNTNERIVEVENENRKLSKAIEDMNKKEMQRIADLEKAAARRQVKNAEWNQQADQRRLERKNYTIKLESQISSLKHRVNPFRE